LIGNNLTVRAKPARDFDDYRMRVAKVIRDYAKTDRTQASPDNKVNVGEGD
jgi:hypothetical protein